MHKLATLSLALTLALTATPALAQSPSAPEFLPNTGSSAPFSRAVQVGDTLYLAGQIGVARPDDTDPTNGIEAETRRAMERIGETLALYNLSYDALFKCTVWLADIDNFGAFNAVYRNYFEEGGYPVRSTMAVKGLAGGAAIEIECIAHNPQGVPESLRALLPDWSKASAHFLAGEERATNVFTRKEASVCVGRWRLQADAVDDGAFPDGVAATFPRQLRLRESIGAAEFFRTNVMDRAIMRRASDEAEGHLRKALNGDVEALQTYFEELGLCSTKPESAGDGVIGDTRVNDVEGPAG